MCRAHPSQFHPNDDSAISVLTYAVEHVKVEHVILVGHTNCGGAAACAQAASSSPESQPESEPTSALARWLAPLTDLARSLGPDGDLTALVEANVRVQVGNILTSEVLEREWKIRDVHVHGWVYELETGKLRDLGISAGRNGPLQY